jgi:CO/xanthine dehydrogenase Mo-binding subunit
VQAEAVRAVRVIEITGGVDQVRLQLREQIAGLIAGNLPPDVQAQVDQAFADADVVSTIDLHYPRSHPSPMENCGSIADYDRATGKLTVYMTSQAPHIVRAAVAMVAEIPEHQIRIISPDLGGGFGVLFYLLPLGATVGAVVSLTAAIGQLLNPEYAAIRDILGAIKP